MPVLTIDDIKTAIENDEVAGITIDTSIYEQYQFGFEIGHLARVSQFARSDVKHLIVDVVWHEVSKHLVSQANTDRSHVKNSLKPLGNSWGVNAEQRDATVEALFGNLDAEQATIKRQQKYVDGTAAQILIAAEHADLPKITELYFKSEAPFSDRDGKKNEFPDALTLLTLEKWAANEDKFVLAVAKDGDWKRFCETSEHLLYIEDLPQALSAFHNNADVALSLVLRSMQKNEIADFDKELLKAINEKADRIDVTGEGDSQFSVDLELTDVVISTDSPVHEQLTDFEVIEYVDNVLHVKATIENCKITAEFDANFEKWDGIDKEYLGMGSATISGEELVDLEVLLTFDVNDGEIEFSGAEPVFERITMAFSDLEPDWMSDPDSYE